MLRKSITQEQPGDMLLTLAGEIGVREKGRAAFVMGYISGREVTARYDDLDITTIVHETIAQVREVEGYEDEIALGAMLSAYRVRNVL